MSSTNTSSGRVPQQEVNSIVQAILFKDPSFTTNQIHRAVLNLGSRYESVTVKQVKTAMKSLEDRGLGQEDSEEVKMYTVGGSAASSPAPRASSSQTDIPGGIWEEVELDAPMMPFLDSPHQAVLAERPDTGRASPGTIQGLDIYKIQLPMGSDGSGVAPMLVYNRGRARRTFIQPTMPAFQPLAELVRREGVNCKIYVYARGTNKDKIIEMCVNKTAPQQPW